MFFLSLLETFNWCHHDLSWIVVRLYGLIEKYIYFCFSRLFVYEFEHFLCRFRRHCNGLHLTPTLKLEPFSRSWRQQIHHRPTSAQINLLQLFRKLLMHMGKFRIRLFELILLCLWKKKNLSKVMLMNTECPNWYI